MMLFEHDLTAWDDAFYFEHEIKACRYNMPQRVPLVKSRTSEVY